MHTSLIYISRPIGESRKFSTDEQQLFSWSSIGSTHGQSSCVCCMIAPWTFHGWRPCYGGRAWHSTSRTWLLSDWACRCHGNSSNITSWRSIYVALHQRCWATLSMCWAKYRQCAIYISILIFSISVYTFSYYRSIQVNGTQPVRVGGLCSWTTQ